MAGIGRVGVHRRSAVTARGLLLLSGSLNRQPSMHREVRMSLPRGGEPRVMKWQRGDVSRKRRCKDRTLLIRMSATSNAKDHLLTSGPVTRSRSRIKWLMDSPIQLLRRYD